jgi:hypothetical protein
MASETAADLISDEMRALIDKVQRRRTSYPVSASDIRRWAVAIYYPDAPPERFLAVGAAGGEALLVAPQEFNPFAWVTREGVSRDTDVTPGYLEERAGVTPPPLNVVVNGGWDCEYGVPIQEGDVITSEHSIASYRQTQGKSGPLLLTNSRDRWTNQRGELVRNCISTLVRY